MNAEDIDRQRQQVALLDASLKWALAEIVRLRTAVYEWEETDRAAVALAPTMAEMAREVTTLRGALDDIAAGRTSGRDFTEIAKAALAQCGKPIKVEAVPLWRVGAKVPVNVYDGDRPVCQCHTAADARLIVAAVNALAQAGKDGGKE